MFAGRALETAIEIGQRNRDVSEMASVGPGVAAAMREDRPKGPGSATRRCPYARDRLQKSGRGQARTLRRRLNRDQLASESPFFSGFKAPTSVRRGNRCPLRMASDAAAFRRRRRRHFSRGHLW